MENYYEILGINDHKCLQEEIKKNYHKMSLKYHPDKNNGEKEYEEKFKLVKEAYDVLSNEETRKVYDIQYFLRDVDITEEDYKLLLIYYNSIINSNEYKLFKLLYNSIPPKVKENLWNKFSCKDDKIIPAQKSIDIVELSDDISINLVVNSVDYINHTLKIVYIFSNTGIYYLYLRKPPKKIIIDNGKCFMTLNFFIIN